MKILALILLLIGGSISYGAKKILPFVLRKKEITDSQIIAAKFVGLAFIIAAAVIVFNI